MAVASGDQEMAEGAEVVIAWTSGGYGEAVASGINMERMRKQLLLRDEEFSLFEDDIQAAIVAVSGMDIGWDDLIEARKRVLVDMCFSLGAEGLLEFKKMLSAVRDQEWEWAAHEMLHSLWASQVGDRAVTLAKMMLHGVSDE